MKMKKIMLITFLLLAVLTIGTVSAADDTSSDNLTVGENDASDILEVDDAIAEEDSLSADYDWDEYDITVNEDEEICIDEDNEDEYDEEAEIAEISLPKDTKGSFRIYNGEEIVAKQDFKSADEEDSWYYDEDDDLLYGSIWLSHLDFEKFNDGDVLTFKFLELNNGKYSVVDSFTVEYTVTLTDIYMMLTAVGDSGMTEEDVEIKVKDINITSPDKNFTIVDVASKNGIFKITVDSNEEDEIVIFEENLFTTQRPYTLVDDGNGNESYRFGFSFTDINNYLQNSIYQCTFLELIERELVYENGIYFYLNEDDEDETEIDSKEMSFEIKNGRILFKDEEEPVDAEYDPELEITMEEDWQDHDVVIFTVKKGIKGKIVIYLNDDTEPAFEKDISELTPDEDSDESENYYTITINDLGISQAGEYIIKDSFVDENGDVLYQYDEEEPEKLILNEPQVTPIGNVSIKFISNKQKITGEEIFVIINGNASADETVKIIIDGKHEFTVELNEIEKDDEGNYTINAEKLDNIKLAAGIHAINVTYKNQNASGNITLYSNLEIDFPQASETVYTTFNNIYVTFDLEEGEITQSEDNNATISVTITDADGNVADTFEVKLTELPKEDESYVIRADPNKNLNGKYTVTVRYFNGTEGETQAQGTVNFKEFKAEDCNAEIMESVNDKNDHVITFTSLPQSGTIYVEIDDGGNTVDIKESDVDEENGVYYIKFSKLGGVSDGSHSISVYVIADGTDIELANGNVLVDVEENVDPELNISIANITEGKNAVINIKTHANFSGIVPVKIANITYNVSVVNGSGSLDVPGLSTGDYNATATFNGNEFFYASTKNTTFTVKAKVATAISAAAVTTTYATSKNIIVTLKDADGNVLAEKEVTVVFNGVTKTIKTNAKGQASLAIGSKLAPKTYPVKFSFAGDDEYLASAGSAKVIVKKAKPKITAKKKTFKAKKKVKKYKITLKTNKGKAIKKAKVTIKVKGKTYKAKTNAKGKATFKIKKLTRKGKYKATVKFSGNKYYSKVTKKVKITVKK